MLFSNTFLYHIQLHELDREYEFFKSVIRIREPHRHSNDTKTLLSLLYHHELYY